MKAIQYFLILLFIIFNITLYAAMADFTFTCRTKVIRGDEVCYEMRQHTYQFAIEVISDYNGMKPESNYYRHSFIIAIPEERYSVQIHNPMPIRVAVNLRIDGLNSINGEPCGPSDGPKWLLEPYTQTTIQGWQVSSYSARRFYFTNKGNSYAAWRSYQLDRDLTIRCGQIASAFFWNKRDMEDYFERHPIIEYPIAYDEEGVYKSAPSPSAAAREHAGTGMGEHQSHPVRSVSFYYDTGMYREHDMVRIFYDFSYPRRHYQHHHGYPKYPPDEPFAPEIPYPPPPPPPPNYPEDYED